MIPRLGLRRWWLGWCECAGVRGAQTAYYQYYLRPYHTHRNSWCDPFKTWQKAYSFNPTANLTEEESKFVLGGQHLLWAEQSNPHNLDPVVWPRAASSAELFWTGPGQNVSSALPRLHDLAFRMQQRGVGAISLQPLWCALRPGACDLTA